MVSGGSHCKRNIGSQYMVAEEVHVFYFEHTKFEVPLIHPREDIKHAIGYTLKVIANTYMAFNVCTVNF